jgi:cyclohexa-1,5-dienecarbonyl-CoA hydratase
MSVRIEKTELDYRLTLSSPPLNILDVALLQELRAALGTIDNDRHLLIVASEGRAFSAGASVHDHAPERVAEMLGVFHGCFRLLEAIEMPTVALVHGDALGGGLELAAACDFILASASARFGTPEINLGAFAPVGSWQLGNLVPPRRALEMLLTGDSISADEALDLGLVNAVFPAASFVEDAERWLARLQTKSASSLRYAKRAFRTAHPGSLGERLDSIERLYLDGLMKTEDAVEGVEAFIEKRAPRWKHR